MSTLDKRSIQKLSLKFNTNASIVSEFISLIGKENTVKTLQMTPKDLTQTARVNFLKSDRKTVIQKLKEEKIIAKPIENIPEGINIIKGSNKLGSSLTYLCGEIMPQGLGSMYSVSELDPKPGEIILDMAASPGNKSAFINQRMENEGTLYVNDISTKRYRQLIYNLSRNNSHTIKYLNQDGRKLGLNNLDKILLDSPCSGNGLIVSKPTIRNTKNISSSIQLQNIQIQLLNKAIQMLKPGGICVYSTCSISTIENENVVEKFSNQVRFHTQKSPGILSKKENKLLGTRYYPHEHLCDGFFISRMEKL